MFRNLYNWVFSSTDANLNTSIPDQIKDLQSNTLDMIELIGDFDVNKIEKVQSVNKSFIVTRGYLNSNPEWTLVLTLPSVYFNSIGSVLKKYILTNFKITNPNYRSLKLTIDGHIIIDDVYHPWRKSWKTLSNPDDNNTDCISYLTFPIQEINGQNIRFEITFEKNMVIDPKTITLSYDINQFKDKNDELNFFNAWVLKKYDLLTPVKYFKNYFDCLLSKNYIYYEMIASLKESLNESAREFPIDTIKLTDSNDKVYVLKLCDYDQVDNYYRVVLTKNYIDGLSGGDWKSIEIIPKINCKDKIKEISFLCSGKLQFKNLKFVN